MKLIVAMAYLHGMPVRSHLLHAHVLLVRSTTCLDPPKLSTSIWGLPDPYGMQSVEI
ncbi:hypothetical protein RchiOBHm_Chr3g0492761 [Rosa chinensis]|uniref:Uncharacterized protein n=1 Tax=Rosa chinensis TaxID=74649 RepID=A0A2P6RGL0_ROSCH|nr:hypothetical protein RchiOBHm_Chr3g0492761 [Rosa chinensis]